MSPRDRDSDAYSEMPVYQWYVENVVPHLQDPEILLKYPRTLRWPSLTFPWRAYDEPKFYNIGMEESDYNVNLWFEGLNGELTQKGEWWTNLEMQKIKQLGIHWERSSPLQKAPVQLAWEQNPIRMIPVVCLWLK